MDGIKCLQRCCLVLATEHINPKESVIKYFKNVISYLFVLSILLMALPSAAATSASDEKVCPNITGFVIIGEAENIIIKSKDLRLKARIDTGAQTSSLGVVAQQSFERDGKKWLQFSVKDPDSERLIVFERPVVRNARIKQHGAEAMERSVVTLTIVLGEIKMEREFTIVDRSNYTFPVLIGRNVLSGQYLVDVNRRFSNQHSGVLEE